MIASYVGLDLHNHAYGGCVCSADKYFLLTKVVTCLVGGPIRSYNIIL